MENNNAGKVLLASLAAGEESAFASLFNEFNIPLTSYAFRILNDKNEAREVVHTTFCKLWDNHKKLEISDSIKAYLYKSVYNNSITMLRKKRQYAKFTELGLGDLYFNRIVQNPHDEMRLFDSETRKIIISAINELPEKCREVFIKCKMEGETYSKVAEDLHISVKTVESQMSIALKKLRAKLDWLMILLMMI
ncbi:MAG: RNA polymerase sigma-70 factor [Bacteroidetes bacterium HGW-Bacteroidetes-10]|jgi:RNA polymerase sigma-70 factor (ECF subfamily)|nr:MAG: RNA polymerase sigma-70 factor [Bacteroidetes bacterium HGW-Bacteroidetes-10]